MGLNAFLWSVLEQVKVSRAQFIAYELWVEGVGTFDVILHRNQ